jgi:WD40 repeat protein
VFDLSTFQLLAYKEAHDGEILTLDYSPMTVEGFCLLASGSRDGLIHLYDVQRDYELLETLGDHAASVTAVKFGADGTSLISCSADKSIKFRCANKLMPPLAAYFCGQGSKIDRCGCSRPASLQPQ